MGAVERYSTDHEDVDVDSVGREGGRGKERRLDGEVGGEGWRWWW